MGHPLDNPIWASLTTRHRRFALGSESIKRYPADVGPFVAVADAGVAVERELQELVGAGEAVDFCGMAPALPPDWTVTRSVAIQMVCARPIEIAASAPGWTKLTTADRDAMLELTALVYPAYFRQRTAELGPYIGIKRAGMLAAMAGERMATDEYVEVSAVCTHPQFLGRGYAALLVGLLVNDILARGSTPFLHVSDQNTRAIALYERLGFVERARLGLWLAQRP